MSCVEGPAADCPGLASPADLKRWRAKVNFENNTMSLCGREFQPIQATASGHPAIQIMMSEVPQPEGIPGVPDLLDSSEAEPDEDSSSSTSKTSDLPDLTDSSDDELTGTTTTQEEQDLRRFSEYLRRQAEVGEVGPMQEGEECYDAVEDSDAESYYETSDQAEGRLQQAAEQSSSDSEDNLQSVLNQEAAGTLTKGQKRRLKAAAQEMSECFRTEHEGQAQHKMIPEVFASAKQTLRKSGP